MNQGVGPRRVLFGVTAPVTARSFLRGQLAHLTSRGWDVQLLCGEVGAEDFADDEGASAAYVVKAGRQPSLRDPLTLFQLWRLLRKVRPDVVVMGTPKIGVLGTIAARLARVPRRVYLMHGYRAEGLTGHLRRVMRAMDRAGCAAATDVVAVSGSLRQKLLDEGVASPGRLQVLGSGSANGIDRQRFVRPVPSQVRAARRELGVPPDARVIACVGRLTADKGLQQLPDLWRRISRDESSAWMLVAGEAEFSCEADRAALEELRNLPRVRLLGHVSEVEVVYRASDLLLLLSRREGLGMVALEAASCGVPTLAWRVTGVVDAVVDGETGVLVSLDDQDALITGALQLLGDEHERRRLGVAAADRAARDFDQVDMWNQWAQLLARTTHDRQRHEVRP